MQWDINYTDDSVMTTHIKIQMQKLIEQLETVSVKTPETLIVKRKKYF